MNSYWLNRQARRDLVEIWDYVADDSEIAADGLVRTIVETFRILAQHPRMGRSREDLCARCRSFAVGQYVIVYRVGTPGARILRVVHGMQDLPRLFPA